MTSTLYPFTFYSLKPFSCILIVQTLNEHFGWVCIDSITLQICTVTTVKNSCHTTTGKRSNQETHRDGCAARIPRFGYDGKRAKLLDASRVHRARVLLLTMFKISRRQLCINVIESGRCIEVEEECWYWTSRYLSIGYMDAKLGEKNFRGKRFFLKHPVLTRALLQTHKRLPWPKQSLGASNVSKSEMKPYARHDLASLTAVRRSNWVLKWFSIRGNVPGIEYRQASSLECRLC